MIILDGIKFDCIVGLSRQVNLTDLYREETKDGLTHRKLQGKKHLATITFGSRNREEYKALFDLLSQEVPYHTLTIGEWDNKTFDCMVTTVADTYLYTDEGGAVFDDLEVEFEER